MSSENETEVIIFPIRFEVDPQNVEDISESVESETGEETQKQEDAKTPEQENQAETLEALTEFVESTDKQGLATLSQFSKNPGQLVENEFLATLGRAGVHGALAAAIITTILATPEIIRTIIQALAVKGGPLNQDFNRFFADENQLGFSRELQYRRAVGLDVVITNDSRGFLLTDPAFVNNSLVDVDKTRSIRLSTEATQYGYVNGM